MAEKKILIVCGEPSGDLNAANLAKEILKISPQTQISAVGGALLKEAGADIIYDIKELSVLGLFDVLKKLPRFFELKDFVLKKIDQIKPDCLILVDFSGFNLRLARSIDKKIPVIYYVSPQVWASRPGRIETIRKYIDKMIVLFKFEEEFYAKHGIIVDFVGHPLLDIVRPSMGKLEFHHIYKLSEAEPIIALLPGSRISEIKNILPAMMGACQIIDKEIPAQFIIAKVPSIPGEVYQDIISKFKLEIKIIEGLTYDVLDNAEFCMVASGTATLETAIMQKPFLVIYKMDLLNYLLYKPQIKIPFISLVNILAGKKIVPEFIQFKATAKNIAAEALNILKNPIRFKQIRIGLEEVKSCLGQNGAAVRAAKIILD